MTLLSDEREHSYTDIARALDVPIGSISRTRARCIAKLRPLLAG
jgi:DNA-directed RNA polymerase specialized sigma24 family protein